MTLDDDSISPQLIQQRVQGRYSAAQAALVRRLGNLELAEDALQDALMKALEVWPEKGIPEKIVPWLVTTGLNAFRDSYRREQRGKELINEASAHVVEDSQVEDEADDMEDDVLRLIFMCCHPALALENQIALTLKTVMGFSQGEVASALLIQERTLEQRIVRSKKKIAANGIDFELPESKNLNERIQGVQHVLYLIFNEGYYGSSGTMLDQSICRNAIILCRSLCRLYPTPENLGLLALMLFQDARAPARLDAEKNLVTLDKQDRSLWRQSQIREADVLLQKALRRKESGSYQLQAAIAGLHSLASNARDTDWFQIAALYKLLLSVQDEPVVRLNYGVALMYSDQLQHAAGILNELESSLRQYSPYWAAKAKLAEMQSDDSSRVQALKTAIELCGSEEELRHYQAQLTELQVESATGGNAVH